MATNDRIETNTPQGEQDAQIARLNASIAEEEKKISFAYYHIGKKYVDLHAQDYEQDFSDMIEYIQASEQRIRAAQKKISELKAPPCCKRCGAELEPDAGFCSACGAPVSYTGPSQQPVNTQPQQRPVQQPVFTPQQRPTQQPVNTQLQQRLVQQPDFAPQQRPAQPPVQNTQPPQQRPAQPQNVFAQPERPANVPPQEKPPVNMQQQNVFAQPQRPESAGFKVTIPDDEPTGERRCPRCGTVLESNCIYCTECGMKL